MTSSKKTGTENISTAFFNLFLKELREMYQAENKQVINFLDLCNATFAEDLEHCFENHNRETVGHVDRLEIIFDHLNELPLNSGNQEVDGLFKEAKKKLKDVKEKGPINDSNLIMVAKKIEHYEISAYSTLLAMAKILRLDDCAKLLRETLEEEKRAEKRLTLLAEGRTNTSAMGEGKPSEVIKSKQEYPPQ